MADEVRIISPQRHGLSAVEPGPPLKLLSYTTTTDRLVMLMGCIFCVIYGELAGTFQRFGNDVIGPHELNSEVARFALYFIYLGIGIFVFVFAGTVTFFLWGDRIIHRLRVDYLKSIIRQDIAFFDILGSGQITSSLTSDIYLVQDALSAKLSLTLTSVATCTSAFVIIFVESWRLALVLLSAVVGIAIANSVGTRYAVRYNKGALDALAKSNSIAEEALRSYKHVTAFGIRQPLVDKYGKQLNHARSQSTKARAAIALMTAAFMGIVYLSSGLSFWQGSRFLVRGEATTSGVIACSMAVIICALAISKVAPNAQAFTTGAAGASRLLLYMNRHSPQDPFDEGGMRPNIVKGEITFKSVKLVYPSRPDYTALDDINLLFTPGKLTAVVGASGCGKSSMIGLMERFYEPISGSITLDGVDICSLNLSWLRQQMALVGQEPVLFKASIYDNIKHGLSYATRSASAIPKQDEREKVIRAATIANAHLFISALPQGYDTQVGDEGRELSGGQLQRIAIARALIRDPKILLLDEATAALDAESENIILRNLERNQSQRTTILITHRLTTVRNADKIVMMANGHVAELGTHDELVQAGGIYATAFARQDTNGISMIKTEREGIDASHESVDDAEVQSQPFRGDVAAAQSVWSLVRLAYNFNREERSYVAFGLLCCLVTGAITPVQSIFFAKSIQWLSVPPPQFSDLRSHINFWSLLYLVLGLVAFGAWSGQGLCLAYCSEALTRNARASALQSILRQDVEFFDRPINSTGDLMAILSRSATHLAGLGGAVLSTILTAFATLVGGIILSLIIGWKLALVFIATIPLILASGWLRLRILASMDANVRATYSDSAAYAAEAVAAIRTVAAFSLEESILQSYQEALDEVAARIFRSTLISSALYAASQAIVFPIAALGFWYGGTLIADGSYTSFQFFVCFSALVSGSQSVSAVFNFAPDLNRAVHGAQDFCRLLHTMPAMDSLDSRGVVRSSCNGLVEFQNVSFEYRNRPGRYAVQDLSFRITPGQTIAFVGRSGSGKSTVIALLERFYDPTSGDVLIDGHNLRHLDVQSLRSYMSLVGQNSVLYQGTIRENLTLGLGRSIVTNGEIEQACAEANILEFIQGLPDGLNTEVGSRGTTLSGGERQRIAIARALLRNPTILLLDEATSALDGESEDIVQEALAAVSRGRATIMVAHRLRTVRDAHVIFVMEKGLVVERGNHEQLLKAGGRYAELFHAQSLEERKA
ncbi:leptomycin B resistance protein pmd1 [Astrocystis sublimbata]|nr:leptomycin B resistance protein pmd1 [Astrocystis sublimbata]